ncbi:MAG: trehalose-phosphatase [Candidatus Dormibacteria bacterium]
MAGPPPGKLSDLAAPLVRLARRGSLLVASDFDGTLAPVVRDPRRARPLPEAARALTELARLTPVAVISGRDLANLARQCPLPGVVLLGSYGLEPWREGGSGQLPRAAASQSPRLQALAVQLQQATGGWPGVEVEAKALGIAVHYRNSPERQRVGAELRRLLEGVSQREGLGLLRGRQVLELRDRHAGDKGTALVQLLDRMAPRGCVFAGDDFGDLPAMVQLHGRRPRLELALALAVLSPETPPGLQAEADFSLSGPDQWAMLLDIVVGELARAA